MSLNEGNWIFQHLVLPFWLAFMVSLIEYMISLAKCGQGRWFKR